MAIALGDTLDTTFTVLDSSGSGVTGLSPSVIVAVDPDDAPFGFTVTELGGGSYKATADAPAIIAGHYYALIAANDPLGQKFDTSWRVGEQRIGDVISGFVTVLDRDGAAVTDLSPTVTVGTDPSGAAFAFTVTELGYGAYRITSTERAEVAGTYFAQVAANDPEGQVFQLSWDVDPHPEAREPDEAIRTPARGGLTLRELRIQVSSDLGDYEPFVATGFGATNTVVDTVHFARIVHHFRGMELTFTDGSVQNLGLSRTIVGFDPTAQTVTVSPDLNVTTRPGDSGELHNHQGRGWTFSQVNAAINAAIARAGELHATVPVTEAGAATFDRATPVIAVPDHFAYVTGITYTDRTGVEKALPPGSWRVDLNTMQIAVQGRYVDALHGRSYVVQGRERPHQLADDWERTSLPADWLVAEAKAMLTEGDVASSLSAENRARLFNVHRQGADARRALVITRMPPNSVRVR